MKIGQMFGLDEMLEKAREGLVPVKVMVHKEGKSFLQTMWLRPGQKPPPRATIHLAPPEYHHVGVESAKQGPGGRPLGHAGPGTKPEPKPEAEAVGPIANKIHTAVVRMLKYDKGQRPDVEGTADDFNLTFQADRGGDDGLFRPRPHEEDDDWPEFVGAKKVVEVVQAIVGKDYKVSAWAHEKGLFSVGVGKIQKELLPKINKPKRMIQTEPKEIPAAPKDSKEYTKQKVEEESRKTFEIPAKGQVLKEREEPKPVDIKEELKQAGFEGFKGDLDSYFKTQGEIASLKASIEEKAKALEETMSKLRPYLAKLDNLEKKEGKFRAKFKEDGFEYEFLQFTRSSVPWKDMYTSALNKLNEEQKGEMRKLETQLQKITAQEKFGRDPVVKSLRKSEDAKSGLIESLKNLVTSKEKGLRMFQRMMVDARKKIKKSMRYVIMTNELVKAHVESHYRTSKKGKRFHVGTYESSRTALSAPGPFKSERSRKLAETKARNERFKRVMAEYARKTDEIRAYLAGGGELKIRTYLGELPVTGLDHRGEWATSGKDWSRRSWAISSSEIEPWHAQVLSAQQTAVAGPAIDPPIFDSTGRTEAEVEEDKREWDESLTRHEREQYGVSEPKPFVPVRGLFDAIGPGDRVTIVNRFGQTKTGRVVMRGPAGWVLNMGGAHGTPAIATPDNVVSVKKGSGKSVMGLSSPKKFGGVSFDFNKMKTFISQDKFLQSVYEKRTPGTDVAAANVIFNTYVLGDSVMEREYEGEGLSAPSIFTEAGKETLIRRLTTLANEVNRLRNLGQHDKADEMEDQIAVLQSRALHSGMQLPETVIKFVIMTNDLVKGRGPDLKPRVRRVKRGLEAKRTDVFRSKIKPGSKGTYYEPKILN